MTVNRYPADLQTENGSTTADGNGHLDVTVLDLEHRLGQVTVTAYPSRGGVDFFHLSPAGARALAVALIDYANIAEYPVASV